MYYYFLNDFIEVKKNRLFKFPKKNNRLKVFKALCNDFNRPFFSEIKTFTTKFLQLII